MLRVRVLTIVQGLVLLAAAGYLSNVPLYFESLATAVFGLLFTAVLFSLQHNYWLHFSVVLDRVVGLEGRMRAGSDLQGPWSAYDSGRRERHGFLWWKASAVYGPFLLLLLAFAVVGAKAASLHSWFEPDATAGEVVRPEGG